MLFSAAGHVVDEGAIDVGAAATDRIEESLRVRHKVLRVGQFLRYDLGVADLAEHHQAA